MSRILVASLSLLAAVAWPLDGAADANIVVDGSFGDWPADCWGFQDVGGDNPPPYADIQELRLTNNNASGSDGNLFVGVDFFNTFNYNIGNHDVDVWLYLDIDGDGRTDGAADRAIELTEQQVFDGTGALVGTFSQSTAAGDRLEAGIPYSLLGLTHGADTFGVSFAVTGHPNNVEYSPEPGDASDGMLIYDGTQGDGIEPLAVRLLALQAAPAPGGVELTWVTASERRNAGFHLLRASPGGRPVRLTAAPVPGLIDAPVGRLYRYLDPEGRTGDTYLLEDVEIGGARHRHPPVVAGASRASLASPRAATRVEPPRAPRVRRPRLASGEVAQLAVPQAGLLRLGGAQLAALGLSAQNTALTRASGAVPVLRDGDGLVFVGAPSRDRHAELEVVRAAPGRPLAMPARGVDGACAKPAGALTEQVWIEREREYYVAAPGEDPFFWGSAFPGYPLSLEFDLPGLQPGAGELALRVAGLGAGPHRLLLTLGACDLGEAAWGGDALSELVVPVPAGCLAERGNRLDLALPPDGAWDGVFADGLGVLHARRLRAVAGVLELSARPGSCLELTGLGVAGARLVEVSDPLRPVELRGAAVGPGADGTG
ncbi:MAG TPA: hypothetical protein P5076_17635, partial [Myxococcota bacterium]|nr:hypothetical protein [Myxococcota bacterium]